MPDKPIDRSAYDAFAAQCDPRCELCLAQVAKLAEQGPARQEAQDLLRITVHDVVGEARFLRFTLLSETALELAHILDGSQDRLDDQGFREQLRRWVEQLFDAAKLSSTTVGDAGQSEILRSIRAELGRARGTRNDSAHSVAPGDGGRVLVLDDSEIVRYLLESHLESKGFTALSVESYEQLEARIAAFDPETVLVDINMPGIKGDEVCRRLRRRDETRSLNIVLMSSLSDSELARLAADSGADGFLSKQHGMEELARYLDELLVALPRREKARRGEDVTQRSLRGDRRREDATLRSFRTGKDAPPEPTFSAAGASLTEALEAAAQSAVTDADAEDPGEDK